MWILPFALIAIAVVALDQVSKLLILEFLYEGQVALIPGVLNFTYVENRGMAFGLLSDQRWVFMILSTVGILAMGAYLWFFVKSRLARVALSLVIGGGIGNMIDRCFRTGVIDFIDADFVQYPQVSFSGGFNIRLADFPIFNVADCFITVGCVMLVIYLLFVELPKESKKGKSTSANAESSGEILTSAENVAENDSNEQ